MQIGTLLRKLRDQKRLSVRDVAGKMEVAHSTYMDWEHDKTSPSLKSFIRLAGALELNPIELMTYLTGEAQDTVSPEETTSMAELRKMVRLYQEHNDLLKGDIAQLHGSSSPPRNVIA